MKTDLWASVADLLESELPVTLNWEPSAKQQQAIALTGDAFEVLYGGAAGGG